MRGSKSTVAWLLTPTPPFIRTLGADVYPSPGLVRTTSSIIPVVVDSHTAVAPDPPPPMNSTVGN